MIWNIISNRQMIHFIEVIENELATWPDVTITLHRFGGLQFNYFDKEIGHIHSDGIVNILFSKKIKQVMMRASLVSEHHIFKNSGWIGFYIHSANDVERAIWPLKFAHKRMWNRLQRNVM